MIRVVVADDQELIREGLRLLLDAQDDMSVVGVASDGQAALEVVGSQQPDVVLMDVRMPRLDGVEATRRLLARWPAVRVLVLTTYDVDDAVREALRAGAAGFLLKDSPRKSLLAAVRAVTAGDVLVDEEVVRRLVGTGPERPDPGLARAVQRLTPREHDVWGLVAQGMSNAEIARRLSVSVTTVKTHVAHLLDKLGARDRLQLAALAHRAGVG
ncbi:MAG: response regulator [Actinomycetes bacterium]